MSRSKTESAKPSMETPPYEACACEERISILPPICRERRESSVSYFVPNRVRVSIPKHLLPPRLPPPLTDNFLEERWRLKGPGAGVVIEPPDDVGNECTPPLGISIHSKIPGLATRLSFTRECSKAVSLVVPCRPSLEHLGVLTQPAVSPWLSDDLAVGNRCDACWRLVKPRPPHRPPAAIESLRVRHTPRPIT